MLYYNLMSKGYNFKSKKSATSPLELFFKFTGNLNVYNSFNFSEYDLSTRLSYGMPVTKEEFNSEKSRILSI